MTYEQAIAFWFSHVNFEQRTPAAGDLKLDRMRALLGRLGDPHCRLRILHVAGSKGKGSTSAMLAAVLQRAGYRTGLFTSPHLCRLEERFCVDGQPISRDELTQLLSEIREAIQSPRFLGHPPTFFEIATAVGFLHFVRRRVDATLLEVGLGGRLDSTNVCLPVLAIITSISHDHTRILGDRLSQIAREKAGIVKRCRPVISGAITPEARTVIEDVCRERQAPLLQLERDFHFRSQPGHVDEHGVRKPQVEVTTQKRTWPAFELNLLGEHQAANAAVAIAVIEKLNQNGWHIPDRAVAAGLGEVFWPARVEVVGRRPWIVLDCAHNVASALALIETLEHSFPPSRRLLVFAGSGDKDVSGMFRVLGPHFARAYVTRYTSNQRAIPPEQLADMWSAATAELAVARPALVCPSPADALVRALADCSPDDLVCITGSVFLAGEVRPMLMPGLSEGEPRG